MVSDILNKVSQVFDSLTQSQKTVANYVMENINTIAFNTLDDLAQKIGVSTTTIIRFARRLGYSGYSDMQQDIQRHIKGKVSLPERLSETNSNLKRDQLLIDSFQNDIANLNLTLAGLSEEDLKSTISTIIAGKTVYVLGLRGSFSLAHYMASRLGQIKEHVHLIQAVGMTYPEETVSAGAGDVCIAYMFPRYSKMVANILLWLKKRGVKIILFTSPSYSAVKSYGDIILPCSIKSISFKNSFVAPMCLSNYLVAAVAIENYSSAMDVLARTEEMLSQGYYLGL
ncbi:MurR/RpiR family transcriptional regulator [Thermoanaerobacteraceae bacterium SP2]|nr:MurR/RpiR family transcriptional regulator [Thermoanaerobacteraceae bacterium SP2]